MNRHSFTFPKNYSEAWNELLDLSNELIHYNKKLSNQKFLPILGLCKKASHTAFAIASLVSIELWQDSIMLSRTLLDLEIVMKWLLHKDTELRLEAYKQGLEQEKKRFTNKMQAGKSISSKVANLLFTEEAVNDNNYNEKLERSWSGMTLREMSEEVAMEGNYDMSYWISSIFLHSHYLSITSLIAEKDDTENPIFNFFDHTNSGLSRFMSLTAIPFQLCHIYTFANERLGLQLNDKIESCWTSCHNSLAKSNDNQ
jgi:hypothetical protein